MKPPTKSELDAFHRWMTRHDYTAYKLAGLTGWSYEAVRLFCRGVGRSSHTMETKRISGPAWLRWKRACAGLANEDFDW